ncbi:hypothetical protein D9615_003196 [Tricholomella constricta]|uniref:Histidine-specific methyltransferase SAM-dependent domain-containing protein n=1 Tax=Tricholomella constricta TaxID=117010 RepID=A0A8H5M8B3_9AGAR|nr:hypothetical protein D9615_003196 [Tricholomella constricta]
MPQIEILDIRGSKDGADAIPHLQHEILQGLLKAPGHRTLPSEILYDDEVGLRLYNEGMTTWSEWYYPIVAEKQILNAHGDEIAQSFARSSKGEAVLIELGAGSLEKTSQILSSIANTVESNDSEAPIRYYALDLERTALETAIERLQGSIGDKIAGRISTIGLWGTYEDGIRLIKSNELGLDPDIPVHIIFLGGTIGNFKKGEEDIAFLKNLPLNPERGDGLLLAMDGEKPAEVIERSYGFPAGKEWIMNGLKVAGRALTGDEELFKLEGWDRYAKYNEKLGEHVDSRVIMANSRTGRFEMGYRSVEAQTVKDKIHGIEISFSKDEVILVLFSNKYTDREMKDTLAQSGLKAAGSWANEGLQYYLFSLRPLESPAAT